MYTRCVRYHVFKIKFQIKQGTLIAKIYFFVKLRNIDDALRTPKCYQRRMEDRHLLSALKMIYCFFDFINIFDDC